MEKKNGTHLYHGADIGMKEMVSGKCFLEDTDDIEIKVESLLTGTSRIERVQVNELPKRAKYTIRLQVEVLFVEENVCKILFNVRCLSEGVDVPSLDAVLFLSPRKSQVEVVQTVGRVMRVSPQTGKKRGYVIIPIVTPAGLDPSVALNNNADFDVVWQVLNALKSIDTEFGAIVDGQRNIIDSSKIEVVCVTNKKLNKKANKNPKIIKPKPTKPTPPVQEVFDFNHDEILEQEIRARIVKRVGNRREWGDWAEDVGKICQLQIKHINDVLKDPTKQNPEKHLSLLRKSSKRR